MNCFNEGCNLAQVNRILDNDKFEKEKEKVLNPEIIEPVKIPPVTDSIITVEENKVQTDEYPSDPEIEPVYDDVKESSEITNNPETPELEKPIIQDEQEIVPEVDIIRKNSPRKTLHQSSLTKSSSTVLNSSLIIIFLSLLM